VIGFEMDQSGMSYGLRHQKLGGQPTNDFTSPLAVSDIANMRRISASPACAIDSFVTSLSDAVWFRIETANCWYDCEYLRSHEARGVEDKHI
jgi:hypothetical protein